jgi:ATP-dependent 26S proteasome regulatory subunit
MDIVQFPFIYPSLLATLRIDPPKGLLLYGPPGVGKTMVVGRVAEACKARLVRYITDIRVHPRSQKKPD